jgi:hypothetical protein
VAEGMTAGTRLATSGAADRMAGLAEAKGAVHLLASLAGVHLVAVGRPGRKEAGWSGSGSGLKAAEG